MAAVTESHVEQAALSWLEGLGYAVLHGPDIAPEGRAPERENTTTVTVHLPREQRFGPAALQALMRGVGQGPIDET
ncbi:hypothetical protein [Thiococcus pfennigii]|uniref:hypothetical protein n=1 Tax=Thiococcus pfennigii TaxID=1057 RepID=UPI0019061FA8|nr:hypothetical protein [Thiococcus pfennigii]MBK1732710.1 hypothetical protein [Thiococcus pfennigii]